MSSFVRRIQRQVMPSQVVHREGPYDAKGNRTLIANPARKVFYMGRGDKLGVKNPKGRELVARLKREARRAR